MSDSTPHLPNFLPERLPHRKDHAEQWLHDYRRVVIRISNKVEARTKETGSVDRAIRCETLPSSAVFADSDLHGV